MSFLLFQLDLFLFFFLPVSEGVGQVSNLFLKLSWEPNNSGDGDLGCDKGVTLRLAWGRVFDLSTEIPVRCFVIIFACLVFFPDFFLVVKPSSFLFLHFRYFYDIHSRQKVKKM